MDKQLLKSHMYKRGDTQSSLASAMGLSLSRLNAKINETGGAEFTQTEISFLADRYNLSAKETMLIFLATKYLKKIFKDKK